MQLFRILNGELSFETYLSSQLSVMEEQKSEICVFNQFLQIFESTLVAKKKKHNKAVYIWEYHVTEFTFMPEKNDQRASGVLWQAPLEKITDSQNLTFDIIEYAWKAYRNEITDFRNRRLDKLENCTKSLQG